MLRLSGSTEAEVAARVLMMNRTAILFCLSVLFLVGCATKCIYPARSMDSKQLEGAWIGYTTWDVEFFRLELSSNGSGSFASAYSTNSIAIYRLPSWAITGHKLDFSISNKTALSEPVSLTGETLGRHIRILLKGPTWERTAYLQREDELLKTLRHVKESMADVPITQSANTEK